MPDDIWDQTDHDTDDGAPPPPPVQASSPDERYFKILMSAFDRCRDYKPKFGKGSGPGLTLKEFQTLYEADPFYHWIGLDSPLIYAAHKAAGGITSKSRKRSKAYSKRYFLHKDSYGNAATRLIRLSHS